MKKYTVTLRLITGHTDGNAEQPITKMVEYTVEANDEQEAIKKAKEEDNSSYSIYDTYVSEKKELESSRNQTTQYPSGSAMYEDKRDFYNPLGHRANDEVILDANYNNKSSVTIKSLTPSEVFAEVYATNDPEKKTWQVMTNRLTKKPIPETASYGNREMLYPKDSFMEYYRTEVKPIAIKCTEHFDIMRRIENGEQIDQDDPRVVDMKTLHDTLACWHIGLMIGDIERANIKGVRLNMINSVSTVHGCLNSESYWTNVCKNVIETDEAKNLKELGEKMKVLITKM